MDKDPNTKKRSRDDDIVINLVSEDDCDQVTTTTTTTPPTSPVQLTTRQSFNARPTKRRKRVYRTVYWGEGDDDDDTNPNHPQVRTTNSSVHYSLKKKVNSSYKYDDDDENSDVILIDVKFPESSHFSTSVRDAAFCAPLPTHLKPYKTGFLNYSGETLYHIPVLYDAGPLDPNWFPNIKGFLKSKRFTAFPNGLPEAPFRKVIPHLEAVAQDYRETYTYACCLEPQNLLKLSGVRSPRSRPDYRLRESDGVIPLTYWSESYPEYDPDDVYCTKRAISCSFYGLMTLMSPQFRPNRYGELRNILYPVIRESFENCIDRYIEMIADPVKGFTCNSPQSLPELLIPTLGEILKGNDIIAEYLGPRTPSPSKLQEFTRMKWVEFLRSQVDVTRDDEDEKKWANLVCTDLANLLEDGRVLSLHTFITCLILVLPRKAFRILRCRDFHQVFDPDDLLMKPRNTHAQFKYHERLMTAIEYQKELTRRDYHALYVRKVFPLATADVKFIPFLNSGIWNYSLYMVRYFPFYWYFRNELLCTDIVREILPLLVEIERRKSGFKPYQLYPEVHRNPHFLNQMKRGKDVDGDHLIPHPNTKPTREATDLFIFPQLSFIHGLLRKIIAHSTVLINEIPTSYLKPKYYQQINKSTKKSKACLNHYRQSSCEAHTRGFYMPIGGLTRKDIDDDDDDEDTQMK